MTDEPVDGPDGPTIVPMPAKPDEAARSLAEAIRSIDSLVSAQDHVARFRRAAYLAYIKEGFTAAQALELCTK